MNIRILAIILAAGTAANPAAGEAVSRDEVSLPQFMSSTGRAELQQSRRAADPAAPARRSAEELSAKFSGLAVDAHATPTGEAPGNAEITGRRAVLVAGSSPIVTGSTQSEPKQGNVAEPAVAPKTKKRVATRPSHRKHPVLSRREHNGMEAPQPQGSTTDATPGAGTGWKTGLIGLLTNPAFWHSEPVPKSVGFQ
jgi:hypothetical protein